MNRRVLAARALIFVGLLLSACSHTRAAAPPVGPGPGSATLMPFGAPKVQEPLQASAFVQNPCLSLTAQQVRGVHEDSTPYVFGNDPTSSAGATCLWPHAHAGVRIQISWNTQMSRDPRQPNGLDFYYSRRGDGLSNDRFVPTSVNGYPAAFVGASKADDGARCRLALGVNDNLVATVTYSGDPNATSIDTNCASAVTLAEDILTNVRSAV